MDADRNLLFGVLALQVDLIDADQFVKACTLWTTRKEVPLGDLLVESGWITPADRADVNRLVQRKLRKHASDVRLSLAGAADETVRRSLAAIADPDIRRVLSQLPPADGGLSTTADHALPAGQRYTPVSLHATGGIGRIWLTHDNQLGRYVALKELRPEKAADPRVVARFVREVRITGQLEHPGIVPVYDLIQRPDDQQPCYVMRFIKGRTLGQALDAYHARQVAGEPHSLDLLALLNAFVAVCNAVAYAHAQGIVHRDLKPDNIVLGDFGEVHVVDWGLAKVLRRRPERETDSPPVVPDDAEHDAERTLQGQFIGTPLYMAPEQAAGQPELIDGRTDVYGLGAILYQILTGRPPFTGSTTDEVLRKVREDQPVAPRDLGAGVPPALEAACLRALAKLPAARHGSAGELAEDVRRWLAEVAEEPLKQMAASQRRVHNELGRIQKQLLEAERFAILGQVVAGVTHEINNPLGIVINDRAVLQRDVQHLRDLLLLYQEAELTLAENCPDLARRIREFAEAVNLPYLLGNLDEVLSRLHDGMARIQQIVKDFRNFAFGGEESLVEADLNAGIECTLHIVRGRARKQKVTLEADLVPLPTVHCFPARINQVLLNLLRNALDACPDGGSVMVRSRAATDGVEIHVVDTGSGVDPAIRDRIFEPFFTTKPSDEGIGVGLYISRQIVEGHGGRIELDPLPREGSHFTIRLPLKPPPGAVLGLIRALPPSRRKSARPRGPGDGKEPPAPLTDAAKS
jgi:signal transduction histidine kinase/tRNA A-37 threonylcarbamoyl transferase component Bud32